ncbi:MAG: hypothetical protein CL610_07675 [Anaerolineaceae bacterium]|nr:hypothetical protein [Anaerolineaceae bacterium]
MTRATLAYIPSSHLDLFWLGNYKTCLDRGVQVIKGYLERCLDNPEETFLLETVVFADYFLEQCPEHREDFLRLVANGQIEVGSAYIDRWETLIMGESQIRNIQIGKRWCQDVLGINNPLVTHPDLPAMIPQIAQIYAQADLKYYVTSRKVFKNGQVWRQQAPDGNTIIVLNYPSHYIFVVMDADDVPPELLDKLWQPPMDVEAVLPGFPQGTVMIAGGAGDLAGRETFRERYGRDLEAFVEQYRSQYDDFAFEYTIPSRSLAAYDGYDDLPVLSGEIPSVWGVAPDEEVKFFQRDRQIEGALLTAESLVVAADHLKVEWRPPTAETWQGTFYEQAFFRRDDPIPAGKELAELWRMHIFTQDHNGGGQEGALSAFQKRVIQERCQQYIQELTDYTLGQIGQQLKSSGEGLLVFNPHGQAWSGPLPIEAAQLPSDSTLVDANGQDVPAQISAPDEVVIQVDDVPAMGYRFYPLRPGSPIAADSAIKVEQDANTLSLDNGQLSVTIDLRTGALTQIRDIMRDQGWGHDRAGHLYSIEESGRDIPTKVADDAPVVDEVLVRVGDVESGPLFTQLYIYKRLLHCEVQQRVRLWANEARLDLQTRLYWWGARNQQVRLGLPCVVEKNDIAYGSPFYGVGWTEVAEGAAPRNPDEVSLEDYARYREVQGWLHLRGEQGGLLISTPHTSFYHDGDYLEAVLLRSSPSCGDLRFYWENAGEQVYDFTIRPTEADWRHADAQRLASADFRSPVTQLVTAQQGELPATQSLLRVDGAVLSALYPGQEGGQTVARFYETQGRNTGVELSGPLADAQATAVNLLEAGGSPLAGQPGDWQTDLPAWRIQTVLFEK